MTLVRPKVHRSAHPYGDAFNDPWPGDLAIAWWLIGVLRFDGQVWRAAPSGSVTR